MLIPKHLIMLRLMSLFKMDTNIYPITQIGKREADINVAEGKKKARILNSEAFMTEQVNQAKGIYLL